MSGGRHQRPKPARGQLTQREHEVVRVMAKSPDTGSKAIGVMLGISSDTVDAHMDNIRKKLKVRSRTAAVVKWLQLHAACALVLVLFMGCASGAHPPRRAEQSRASFAGYEPANLSAIGTSGEGPAGVLQSDTGFTWILPRTNRYILIETKDSLNNGVVRYLHDREVYGPSLVIWPGEIDTVNHPELPTTLNPAAFFRTRYTTNTP